MADKACYTIKFLNDTLGYAGAYNSRIFRTTNAGATLGFNKPLFKPVKRLPALILQI
jgi:hypothetical protein